MDPLSITASCVSLLGGIGLVSKNIAGLVVTTREARRDVDGFSRELNSLSLCVEALRDDGFTFPDTLKRQMISILNNCDAVTQEMDLLIRKYLDPNLARRLKWTIAARDEVSRLQERLEAHKAALDIALECANLTMNSAIKDDTSAIKAEITALRMQVLQFQPRDHGSNFLVQRFLDETLTYTESVIDPIDSIEHTSDHQSNADPFTDPQSIEENSRQPDVDNSLHQHQSQNPNLHQLPLLATQDPNIPDTLITRHPTDLSLVDFELSPSTTLRDDSFQMSGFNAIETRSPNFPRYVEHESYPITANNRHSANIHTTRTTIPISEDQDEIQKAHIARLCLEAPAEVALDARLHKITTSPQVADERVAPIVRDLLSQGAQLESRGQGDLKPEHIARMHTAVLSELLRYGAKLDKTSIISVYIISSPLFVSHEERFRKVQFLLEQGADPNGQRPFDVDNQGCPLHWIAARRSEWSSIIPLLVEFGADLEARNQSSETPLDLAILNVNGEAISGLIKAGVPRPDIATTTKLVRANILRDMKDTPSSVIALARSRKLSVNTDPRKMTHWHSSAKSCKRCDDMRYEENRELFQVCEREVLQALGYDAETVQNL